MCVGTGGRGDVDAGALCLSWWEFLHFQQGQAQGPRIHPTSAPCPYAHAKRPCKKIVAPA